MANAKRRRRKNGNRAGRMCITCIVFVFAIVMSTQIIKVYQKDQEYKLQRYKETCESVKEKEKRLETLLPKVIKAQEFFNDQVNKQPRQKELEAYETYTKSQQYVEDVAKSKLGLLYDNEVVFKEQK